MPVVDLLPEFAAMVRQARSEAAWKAAFWSWLDDQYQGGPLSAMLHDFTHLWSGTRKAPALADAQELVEKATTLGYARRAEAVLDRFAEVVGVRPTNSVVLVVGLGAPEGYSRFDRGRNTIFVGLDHKSNVRHPDHFEVILSHELSHAVRDPSPDVLGDYGGWPEMSHDDFVARYAFREHLVSEAMATALSEAVYGGKTPERYLYFDPEEHAWCEAHRPEIAERLRRAIENGEDYRTFYREHAICQGAPACCDYYFGFHLGRFALRHELPAALLARPASAFLERYLGPFMDEFLGPSRAVVRAPVRVAATPTPPREREFTSGVHTPLAAQGGLALPELALLPRPVRRVYRDLLPALGSDPARTTDRARALQEAVGRDGLVYGDAPYEVHPFPLVLSTRDTHAIGWVARRLMRIVDKVVDLYLADPEVRAYFDFPRDLEDLVLLDPGYKRHVNVSRFDTFWDGKHLRFLELNTNGTAGMALAERAAQLLLDVGPGREALAKHRLRPFPLRERLREVLVDAWREARHAQPGELPARVAIVDWKGVPTEAEFFNLQADFRAHGLETVVADPGDFTYQDGKLLARGEHVDLVYRRLTTLDWLNRSPKLEPLARAYRDRAVVMVGSFRADVAHSKKLFAFLSDERWRDRFSFAERSVIDAHVPWTRVLRPGRCLFEGELVDLERVLVDRREEFVLKPSQSFEGRGVLLGAETPPERWAQELSQRLDGSHIVQQRVAAPTRSFVLPTDGKVEVVPLHLHLGEYVFGGTLAGFQAWASQELVISAHSTERAVPVLTLPPPPEDED